MAISQKVVVFVIFHMLSIRTILKNDLKRALKNIIKETCFMSVDPLSLNLAQARDNFPVGPSLMAALKSKQLLIC